MILDTLTQASQYRSLHPGFAEAFAFLTRPGLGSLLPGRHDLDGDRLYVSIGQEDGRGRDGARLEVHRKYIDIQLAVEGLEEFGWMALDECQKPGGPFQPERDIGFFDDRPHTWCRLPREHFAVFFPHDAHAPLAGSGPVKKIVLKVLVAGSGA